MEFRDYARTATRRWRVLATGLLLGVAGAATVTLAMEPVYEARTQLFVSTPQGQSDTTSLLQGSNFSQQRVKSYAELVTSPLVLEPVAARLGHQGGTGSLAASISADCAALARDRLMTGLTNYYLHRGLRPGAGIEDIASSSAAAGVLAGPGDPAAAPPAHSCAG